MNLIASILRLYGKGDDHVEVLTASVRSLDHLLYALKLGSHIITVPAKILKEWVDKGLPIPDKNYQYDKNEHEGEDEGDRDGSRHRYDEERCSRCSGNRNSFTHCNRIGSGDCSRLRSDGVAFRNSIPER